MISVAIYYNVLNCKRASNKGIHCNIINLECDLFFFFFTKRDLIFDFFLMPPPPLPEPQENCWWPAVRELSVERGRHQRTLEGGGIAGIPRYLLEDAGRRARGEVSRGQQGRSGGVGR